MKACSPSPIPVPAADLYGWEREGQFWHGPTELRPSSRRRPETLDPAHALCAWTTHSRLPDGLSVELFTSARDLGDCALATIDLDSVGPGPAAVVAAIPIHRASRVRPEFAFELAAFARFLEGPEPTGSELTIHEQVEQILGSPRRHSTIFALSLAPQPCDVAISVSEHIEQVSISLLRWLEQRDQNGSYSSES